MIVQIGTLVPATWCDRKLVPAGMASELSQLIESELRKAESANKPDEHQRRLTSLRVKVCAQLRALSRCSVLLLSGLPNSLLLGLKCDWLQTGLDQPPPTLLQRVCTTKRQIIAGGVVTALLLIVLLIVAVSHRHHTPSQGRCSIGFALQVTCCIC